MWKFPITLASVIFLCGCASKDIVSSAPTTFSDDATEVSGVIYSLPQSLVNLTVTVGSRKFPSAEQAAKIAATEKDLADVKRQIAVFKKGTLQQEAGKPNVLAQLNSKLSLLTDTLSSLKRQVPEKRGVSASVELAAVTPDAENTYRLVYDHDMASHDTIEIKTSPSGLLESISTTTRDKTSELVKEAIDVAGDAAVFLATQATYRLPQISPQIAQAPTANGCSGELDFSATFLMDPVKDMGPASYKEIEHRLNALSSTQNSCFSVKVYDSNLRYAKPLSTKATCNSSNSSDSSNYPCIFYRRLGTLFVEVTHAGLDELTGLVMIEVPQAGPIGAVEIGRRAFVENIAEVEFENGMLKRIKYDDPSQTMAIASAPFDFLRAIFSIPAEIVNTKSSIINSQASRLTAQAALIDAQVKLEEARAKIRSTEESSGPQ